MTEAAGSPSAGRPAWARKEAGADESRWPAGRRQAGFELAIWGAAIVACAAAVWIDLHGGVVEDPVSFLVVIVSNVFALTLAGLLWLRARPWSPFGRLLLGLAALNALSSLSDSPSSAPYVVGVVAVWITAVVATYAIVAFPSGSLDAGGRAVVGLAAAVVVFFQLPVALVSGAANGPAAIGRCGASCPRNLFLVSSDPSLAHDLDVALGIGRACWGAAIVAYLVVRYTRASRPRRRIVIPVYATALAFSAAFGLSALFVDTLGRTASADEWLRVGYVATRIAFPLGFVGAILLAAAFAGSALVAMARELGSGPSIATVEELVQRVLDDRRARLAFWLPRVGKFADRHGRELVLDPACERRTWRSFGRGSENVLAIEHDPALADDPELVEAVGAATLMALENRRLQQDLLDSIAALRASQRRLLMAGAAERRKIERDLHDSTQQKLVAIRIQLELAREHAAVRSGLRSRLAELGRELDDALDELRAVAHGIYPQLLSDEGLPAALREAARRSGVPVELDLQDVGRLPVELETAVYYCCLEALQNAAKHAGDEATISLRLWRDRRSLRFSVVDDGSGFVLRRRRAGIGLTSMSDRIAAVGGSVTILTAPDEGTAVEGRVGVDTTVQEEDHGP